MSAMPSDLVYVRYKAEGYDGAGRAMLMTTGIWMDRPPHSKSETAVLRWIRADANTKMFRVERIVLLAD